MIVNWHNPKENKFPASNIFVCSSHKYDHSDMKAALQSKKYAQISPSLCW